jgi:hypothetical protein
VVRASRSMIMKQAQQKTGVTWSVDIQQERGWGPVEIFATDCKEGARGNQVGNICSTVMAALGNLVSSLLQCWCEIIVLE